MNSSNPALRPSTFENEPIAAGAARMTVSGATQKTTLLLGLVLLTASYTYSHPSSGLMIGGAIVGLIVALVLCFKHQWAPMLAPVYALAEGLFLGGISAMYASLYQGIVMQAVLLTFGTLFALLAAYQMRLIRATEKFRTGVIAATGGIAIFYLVAMVLGFFGITIPFIHQGGTFGILFSVFVVIVAALNLILDFDLIESGAAAGAPKYMEWYAAFGLLVTLVWLYIEFLRLLSKLQKR